jgi:hypothetical protein
LRSHRFTAGVAVALCAALASSAWAGPTPRRRARVAARYIASKQSDDGSIAAFSVIGSTSDAVLALVAARRGPKAIDKAISYLRNHVDDADSIGERAKVALAAVAAGANPRRFGGANLVAEIRSSQQPDGRYGAATPVFDHAYAMLALVAAARVSPSPMASEWLRDAQCVDGGWQFDEPSAGTEDKHCNSGPTDFFSSDTNTTGVAVQALDAAHGYSGLQHNPFAFFVASRDARKHGWGYDASNITDANSTALVIQAYTARNKTLPMGAARALRALQYRLCGNNAGAFAFHWEQDGQSYRKSNPDIGATIGAVPGLLRRPLPIAHHDVTRPVPPRRRCG